MELALKKGAPPIGISLTVHPEAHVERTAADTRCRDAFGHLTRQATHGDDIRGDEPGASPRARAATQPAWT